MWQDKNTKKERSEEENCQEGLQQKNCLDGQTNDMTKNIGEDWRETGDSRKKDDQGKKKQKQSRKKKKQRKKNQESKSEQKKKTMRWATWLTHITSYRKFSQNEKT